MSLSLKQIKDNKVKSLDFNPLCCDNCFHIRFRDYSSSGLIIGVQQKLEFLITLLFNQKFLKEHILSEDIDCKDFKTIWEKYSREFGNTEIFLSLLDKVKKHYPKCEGILLTPQYRKIKYTSPWKQFGFIPDKLYEATEDDFKYFLSTNWLFNDTEYIEISEEIDLTETYSKFTNKETRAKTKKQKGYSKVQLW